MSAYMTEEEQVEALKKWWKDNGKSVLFGAIVGFGIIFGWQGWKGHEQSQGEAASALYSAMENHIAAGKLAEADADAQQLMTDFSDSVYATFAALQLAKQAYAKGDKGAARTHLQRALSLSSDPTLQDLTRLRLASLLLDMNELDAAASELQASSDLMPGEFAQLRGDLARQRGDLDAARAAYEEAASKGVEDNRLLRMKLVDVGGSAS